MAYIDKDELLKSLEKAIKDSNEYRMAVVDRDFIDLVNDATVIEDVVEVVRCKDCEYWECVCGGTTGRCENPRNGLLYEYTDNFDYCSYGVRKGGDE